MFAKKPSSNKIAVEDAIYSLLEEMANLNGDSDAYARMADQVEKLYKLREVDAKVDAQQAGRDETIAAKQKDGRIGDGERRRDGGQRQRLERYR